MRLCHDLLDLVEADLVAGAAVEFRRLRVGMPRCAAHLASGVYLYRLEALGQAFTGKVLLLK